jgi:hypothetical protein
LELRGAWEPPDTLRPLPNGEGEETQFDFPYGNQIPKNKMERFQSMLGFQNMLVIDCVGKSGSLALL